VLIDPALKKTIALSDLHADADYQHSGTDSPARVIR